MDNPVNIRNYLIKRYRKTTAESYCYEIVKYLGIHPNAAKYKYTEITEYLHAKAKQSIKPGYANRILASLNAYYTYLQEIQFRQDNPIEFFKFEKRGKREIQLQDFFTREELFQIYKAVSGMNQSIELRNKVLVLFLIFQGLTSEEIISLEITDFDLDSRKVVIKETFRTNGRTLELELLQVELLENYFKIIKESMENHKTKRIFITSRGDLFKADTIGTIISGLLHAVHPKPKLDTKLIRGSVIANWINVDKKPIEKVHELSGLRWPSSVVKYRRVNHEEHRELIKKFHPLG